MRLALKFAYNGKNFHGYARQPKLRTVEGEIINKLIDKDYISSPQDANFKSASRTDKGVSALANVIVFETKIFNKNILDTLSSEFSDILFYNVLEVPPEFNPRYAKYRWYRYYLLSENIDFDQLTSTASLFTGEHDFSNFARIEEGKNPVRSLDNIVFTTKNNYLIIDFFAQSFLWNQIRRIISAIEKLQQGKFKKDHIRNALENPNKKVDFGLSSPEPLVLYDIIYNFDFPVNDKWKIEKDKYETSIFKSIEEFYSQK